MVTYLRAFFYVLRTAAIIGFIKSSIITMVVVLDLSLKLGFGYPWWTVFITVPGVIFSVLVMHGANKALKMAKT
jgi:hypothetical protein